MTYSNKLSSLQMEMLYRSPFPSKPGSENGFKSSYGTIPAPVLFFNSLFAFLLSINPPRSFN